MELSSLNGARDTSTSATETDKIVHPLTSIGSRAERAICFDLDGTLIDPYLGISRSVAFALERLGVAGVDDMTFEAFIGPPIQDAFQRLLGPDVALATTAVRYFRERYGEIGLFEAVPYPEISAVLAELSAEAPLFICTSKPKIYADRIANAFGIDRYFAGIYGSELDGTRAKKSELLAWLVEREGLGRVATAMVGDRSHDISAARENGVTPYGVLWGYGSERELVEAGAERLFSTVRDLRALSSIIAKVDRANDPDPGASVAEARGAPKTNAAIDEKN